MWHQNYQIDQSVTTQAHIRILPRFFDQVGQNGHETMYASSGNKHFSLNLVIVSLTKIMNRANKNWTQF